MFASKGAVNLTVNLDEFLSRLRKSLLECSQAIAPTSHPIPNWAADFSQFLYADKSIPPEQNFLEPGKLYITYSDSPDTVMLVGQSKDQKPIKRKLKINTKRASALVTITSEHLDFATGKCFTCKGVGHNFKSALDHYFSSSQIDKRYTYKTDHNVQQEGDAFLLPKVLSKKGHEGWVEEIVNAVRKLFQVVPEDKHALLSAGIETAMSALDAFLKANNSEKIVNFYDPRLWLIVESICKHFDPLTCQEGPKRKHLRDYVIADSCRKLMKDEDMTPGLDNYFQALMMHREILDALEKNGLNETGKQIIAAYKKDNLYPELIHHHEKIRDYHGRYQKHTAR